MTPYALAYHHANDHGIVTAVHLPDSPEPVPEDVLQRLHPAERQHALSLRGYRQVQFAGGRLALRDACKQLGVPQGPVLSTARGAPAMHRSCVASVSHKRAIAVAMVSRPTAGTLGVDIEDYGPPRLSIADRILTAEELAAIEGHDDRRRWIGLLVRFSIKESIYKAIDPYVRRYVGFHEAIVHPSVDGVATVRMEMARGEGPFEIDARYEWLHQRLLTSVRIRRASR